MKNTTRIFIDELERQNIIYQITSEYNDENDMIKIISDGENVKGITVLLSFAEGNYLAMLATCGIKVPEDKKYQFMIKINELNCRYKWVKFQILDGNDLVISRDEQFYDSNIKEASLFAMFNLYSIADDTYSEFMKIMWS